MTDLEKLDEWSFVYGDADDGSVFRIEIFCNGELRVQRDFETREDRERYFEMLTDEAIKMGGVAAPPYQQ
jgi:hypothetical protein